MKFDVIHRLESYFDVMELSQDEKKKRVELANDLFDAFYFVLSLMQVDDDIDKEFYVETLRGRFEESLSDVSIEYEPEYVEEITEEIIDTTLDHLDDEYFTSEDRALLMAENETNTSLNHNDFVLAKRNGAKYKTWVTENDDKVRFTHTLVDQKKIPIDDYFYVGGERMRYPHDSKASADNVVNCRCICLYE